MSNSIIEVKNISKKYNITHERGGYIALRDVLTNIAKSPFAFLKAKTKQAIGLEKKEEFWALKNINFDVKKGEIIGIIGRNGAGKSTLLKILSQITPPTEGEITIRGRVGSLLEVGTGFHPELTGRENIFLNGAILGMTKKEIVQKFDAIVKFAGIEKFLDTPAKRYSSGMYVRLAFSVAAHMEPDILIVDEVLAVGDVEFQKKCLGKMEEVTKQEGRTIIFVSHNMAAIERLCQKTAVMDNGQLVFLGKTSEAIQHYTQNVAVNTNATNLIDRKDRKGNRNVLITEIDLENESGEKISTVRSGETLTITVAYKSKKGKEILKNCQFTVSVKSLSGKQLFVCSSELTNKQPLDMNSDGKIKCKINNLPLGKGKYVLSALIRVNKDIEDWIEDVAIFEVENGDFYGTDVYSSYWEGESVLVKHSWENN
ncbi:MAG: ABC transporter ATP-binding protein [Parcubacteria group bacterium]|nr:ABC transporter ATP-binding protein [Parcubacteria group bacterium]